MNKAGSIKPLLFRGAILRAREESRKTAGVERLAVLRERQLRRELLTEILFPRKTRKDAGITRKPPARETGKRHMELFG